MNKFTCFLLTFFQVIALSAQPSIQWQTTLGGSLYDESQSIQQTPDGGYILAGYTVSDDGDVGFNHGYTDFWIIRLDTIGTVEWKKTFGGTVHDAAFAVRQLAEGGYVVAGFTESNDGDVTGNHGDNDIWVVKLDIAGNILWQKCYGGSKLEEAWDIQQTPDGGYVLAGRSRSNDGDVSGNHGSFDYWVLKLNATAEIEWQKSYGGSNIDYAYGIKPTSDGGYIVCGESQSSDGQVTNSHLGIDAWVVKLNFEGKILWERALGGSSLDRANEIHETRDGGYIMFGQTSSNNGDVTGNHGGYDFWAVKLNKDGAIEWQKALGGSSEDYGQSIEQTNDGGFIATGMVNSLNGDVTGNHGSTDLWVVKLTETGEFQWQKAFGGTLQERGFSIHQTFDGGYILAGDAWSNNGDVSGVMGKTDVWVIKLSPESSPTSEAQGSPLQIYPNPASQSIFLNIPIQEPILSVSIADLLGREVSLQHCSNVGLSSEEVNVADLGIGFYLVQARAASGNIYCGKFWKE